MPFVDQSILSDRMTIDPVDEQPWARVARAGMETENSLFSAMAEEDLPEREAVDYDPLDDLEGYEEFASEALKVSSPESMAVWKRNIDREIENRQIIDAAGWKGVVASVGAGLVDPLLLPFMFTPIRTIGAVRGAGAGAGVMGASELALHSSQETRTGIESVLGITAGTLIGGIVGGMLAKSEARQIARAVEDDFSNLPRSVGAASTVGENKPKATPLDVTSKILPLGQVMTSKSRAARHAMMQMAESSYRLTDEATPVAIETLLKQMDAVRFKGTQTLDRLFLTHRGFPEGGVARRAAIRVSDIASKGERLSRRQFNEEVGKALRRGDKHDVPEVQKAASWYRTNVFNPILAKMKETGLLDEVGDVTGAESYLSRVYNKNAIKANASEFDELLARHFMKGNDELEHAEALLIAQTSRQRIMGYADHQVPMFVVGKPGAAKPRVLTLTDEELEPYLISDIETVASAHINSTTPRILMKERGFDLKEVLEQVTDEYSQLMKKDPSLEREMMGVKANLTAVHERLMGTHGIPEDPTHWVPRATRALSQLNFLAMLGGMTLSAIPDVARPMMVHGFRRYAKGLSTLATAPKRIRLAKEGAQKAGTALDMIQSTRIRAIADIDDYLPHTTAERAIQGAANTFGMVSLMSPWNTFWKSFTGLLTQDAILRKSADWVAGKASKKDIEDLMSYGIDEGTAKRISSMPTDKDGDLWLANIDDWSDAEASTAYNAAMAKVIDTTIVTPGAGDLPRIMGNQFVKLLLQFKSFSFAAHNRMLISGMQQNDLRFYNGLLFSLAMGSLTYGVKQKAAGREVDTSPSKLLAEAVDRSGQLGYLMEVNNISEKLSGGSVGINPALSFLTGDEHRMMSRYASRTWMESLLGPTYGTAGNVATMTRAALSGDQVSKSDIRSIGKVVPYRNLFYIRRYLDDVEGHIAEKIGAE